VLVEHLDVAAERQRRNDEFRLVRRALSAPQRPSEADGKAQDPDAQFAGNPKVAKLVHRDQQADRDDERKSTEQCESSMTLSDRPLQQLFRIAHIGRNESTASS
jgi:hypothetical protein